MVHDLIADSHQRAQAASLPIQSAALLHLSRVLTVSDPGQARNTLLQGCAAIEGLSRRERDVFTAQAKQFAAAVAPDLLLEMPEFQRTLRYDRPDSLVILLLKYGHVDSAVQYLLNYKESIEFPFAAAHGVIQATQSPTTRVALFRRALDAWRNDPEQGFIYIFGTEWPALPRAEGRDTALEIVSRIQAEPDTRITASYGNPPLILTSSREHALYMHLPALRQLDPLLAKSLMAENPQLAAAAARYPNGRDSVREEAEAVAKTAPPPNGPGFFIGGSPDDISQALALFKARQLEEFEASMDDGIELYRKETDPATLNNAPREFWYCTSMFRRTLYAAGTHIGSQAIALLDRIPEDDLRLLAQIELAAALAGLPEWQGNRMRY